MKRNVIDGVHFLLYSTDADADRRFLHDVLGFRGVDAGDGWLIFALPPSEMAVHPSSGNFAQRHAGHELLGAVVYLMCGDLETAVAELRAKGVTVTEVERAAWGIRTTIELPGGGELGLYQPTHPTPLARRTAAPEAHAKKAVAARPKKAREARARKSTASSRTRR